MATHDTEAHRALFEQGMTAKIRSQSGANSSFLTEEEHDDLVAILDGWDARPPAQRSLMKPAYHAAKKYEVVKVGEENVLMVRAQPDEAGDLPALDQRLRVLHAANVTSQRRGHPRGGGARRGSRRARGTPRWPSPLLVARRTGTRLGQTPASGVDR